MRGERRGVIENTILQIIRGHIWPIPETEHSLSGIGDLKIDGFVKSPSAAFRCILSHCSVQVSTPHSLGFARLASGAFYCAV